MANLFILGMLIAVASNLDNLGVGLAYGIQKIRVSHSANALIALVSLLAAWLSAHVGRVAHAHLSPALAHAVGAGLLLGIGIWVFVQPIVSARRGKKTEHDPLEKSRRYASPTEILGHPESADLDHSRHIGCWEAIVLGVALSINALAGGFDAGVVGIPALEEALAVGLFSFVSIFAGVYFGRRHASERLGGYATLVSGMLLILIAIHQFVA